MKMTLGQKILVGFIACALILVVVAFFSFRNSEKFVDASRMVTHTHEVMYEFDLVLAASLDAESGVRGYVISGNPVFLETFNAAKAGVQQHLTRVKNLTADNPLQQQNIELLRHQLDLRMQNLEQATTFRDQSFERARDFVGGARGKQIQDEIRRIVADCRNMEINLLAQRKEASERDARNFTIVFVALLVIIALVLLVVYLIITANLRALKKAEDESADKNWILTGTAQLNEKIRGEKTAAQLSQAVIEQLCNYLGAQVGIIYIYEDGVLRKGGAYAYNGDKDYIRPGEGLAGQAATERKTILFTDVPADYSKISSAIGSTSPKSIICFPLIMDAELKGVIEIGANKEFSTLDTQFLSLIGEIIAIALSAAQSRTKLKELLEEAQSLAEELEAQQEELKVYNEELQEKTSMLERSEGELKTQQEELQQINEELEEKANLLEEQRDKLENARMDLETKAKELEITSKYKTEFLANMSHELRTPLNSILILSQLLGDNKEGRLSDKEVEFARNIHNSGNDQLKLINEILDLSKVEAGKMELEIGEVTTTEIARDADALFTEVARNKSVDFRIEGEKEVIVLVTDRQRLQQILRNLLSNAFKFTPKGGKVTLSIRKVSSKNNGHNDKEEMIAFAVSDTGIGIPQDKLRIVFEAFQQADGSTKRKYGGTGLGLSISRELAHALGGEISVQSAEGTGSTFTLYLPPHFTGAQSSPAGRRVEIKETKERREPVKIEKEKRTENFPFAEGELQDDRYSIHENDKVILIMEDDPSFAGVLLNFVRERNYKGIVAVQGNTGLSYARYYRPDAILLDMKLPVMNGTEVLKYLKNDPTLRHVPVQIISGFDIKKEGMELGAFDFIRKPVVKEDLQKAFDKIEDFVSRKLKKLLIVEDNEQQNKAIRELIGNGDVKSFSAYSGAEGYEMLTKDHFDCVIVDLGLPDMTGFTLLEKIKDNEDLSRIPIIVYTGKDLTKEENTRLMKYANTVVLKTADSHARLLDETMLFLHRVESKLPKEKQRIIRKLHKSEEVLMGKKVLVVDDDIRNIYSLTNVLEEEGLQCLIAENGKRAVEMVKDNPGIDIVLMDIMMPEMDGYEATRMIRSMNMFNKLPIIALTAKAIKGDREKCLDAGMSDYISKPVDIEQLLSLMRVWLYR